MSYPVIDASKILRAEYAEDRWKLKNRVIYVGAGGQVLADVSEGAGDLPVIVNDPFLTDANEAYRRAQIRLALNKEYGRQLRVEMSQYDFEALGIDLGDTVTVNLPSLGISENMYVVEIEYDPRELKYTLTLGGRLELFEEFLQEQIGGDVASRFGQKTSIPGYMGSIIASVTMLQASQRIQAQGRTVRLLNSRPMLYENGVNVILDSDGSIRLVAGATSGSFEFSCLPPSELFTRWLRTQYVADPGDGSVSVDLYLGPQRLYSNIPSDFEIPYYPPCRRTATNNEDDWDAQGATISLASCAILGLAAIRADRTGSAMTLIWPKTKDAGYDILRYFRIYFYTFENYSITIKLYQDVNNYLSATINNSGGAWQRWDILTSSMSKTGNPSKMNWLEITTNAPTLFIDSDYLLYPAGREKLVMKFNLSRPSASSISPKVMSAKFVWREGKT
jgi:hypothetical protein